MHTIYTIAGDICFAGYADEDYFGIASHGTAAALTSYSTAFAVKRDTTITMQLVWLSVHFRCAVI